MRKIIGNEIIAIFHALNGWAFPYFAIGVLFGMWFHMVVERSLAVRAESRKSRGIQYVDPSAVKIEAMAQQLAERLGPIVLRIWEKTRAGRTYRVQMDELRRLNEGCAI